jgi:hypothetical protein
VSGPRFLVADRAAISFLICGEFVGIVTPSGELTKVG